MKIKIKKLHPNATIPQYANGSDAGVDLTAVDYSINGDLITYKTGIAVEIPEGFVGLIFPRSSIRNKSLTLTNSVGVIDSGYRGELQATFRVVGQDNNIYEVGDRIMQMIVIPYPKIEWMEVMELSDSDRGTGGFGSTGV